MKFTGYYIALFALTLGLTASADMTQPDHYLMSPNATSLGEYGAVPVSLFTGIPEISIPITEVSAGSHTLPISLSYHGGGVRPDQHPGWVGLGWTLNAGGCVSRIVNGIPDETFYYNLNNGLSLDTSNLIKFIYRIGYFYDKKKIPSEHSGIAVNQILDREPDQFIFNFCNISGTFYYNSSEGWIVESERDIKIDFDIEDDTNYIYGVFDGKFDDRGSQFFLTRSRVICKFKLIDEYGNEYYFGSDCSDCPDCGKNLHNKYNRFAGCYETCSGSCNSIEYSVGFFSQRSEQPIPTSWMLTKIKYSDGNEVTFNYQKKDFITQLGVSEVLYDLTTGKSGTFSYGKYIYYNGDKSNIIDSKLGYISGSLISPSYLKCISGPNWKILFDIERSKELPYSVDYLCSMHYANNRDSYWKRDEYTYINNFTPGGRDFSKGSTMYGIGNYYKLTSIKLLSKDESLRQYFTLKYNDTNNKEYENPRLALLSITDSLSGETHKFEYDNIDKLPLYCTYNIDHWGFYKNTRFTTHSHDSLLMDTNFKINRQTTMNSASYESGRTPEFSNARIGSLIKITYPTGGYSELVYEPNSYQAKVNDTHSGLVTYSSIQYGGGIRIKQIINYMSESDKDGQVYREYIYDNQADGKSKSSSGILLRPWKYKQHVAGISVYVPALLDNIPITCTLYSSGHVNSFGSFGESVTVGYTWVTEKYPDGSYSIYNFSNFDNGYPDEGGYCISDFNVIASLPYSSHAISRGKLLSKEEYDANHNRIHHTRYNYNFNRDSIINARKVEVIWLPFKFQGGVYPTDIRDFEQGYNVIYDYQIPTYTMRPDSVTTTEYLDGKPTVEQTVTTTYHRGNLPQKETVSLSSGETTRTEYTYLDDLEDSDAGEILRASHKVGILRSKKNYLIDSSNQCHLTDFVRYGYKDSSPVYPDTIIAGYGDSGIFETTRHKFDSRYNITEIESDGAAPVVFVWGYNRSYPVAKIVNARIADVEAVIGDIEQFSLTPEPNFAKLESLRAALPSASVWIYRFKSLVGLVEVTDPSGNAVKYSYDKAGRLSGIKDVDGHFTDVFDYNYAR